MSKFQNKYRGGSIRLPNWDYRSDGGYFITICTKNRNCFFGNIAVESLQCNDSTAQDRNDSTALMQLSEIGKLAHDFWMEIPKHFPFVELDEFVIMPNHVHGIVVIKKSSKIVACNDSTDACNDSTNACGNPIKNQQMAKISPQSGSLSVIIRSYKSVVTKNARKINSDFGWQSRFHDHIIRNETEFGRISNYIKSNPKNWSADKFRSFNSI